MVVHLCVDDGTRNIYPSSRMVYMQVERHRIASRRCPRATVNINFGKGDIPDTYMFRPITGKASLSLAKARGPATL